MNYTKNYQLPQWVETDRIQMEDFNKAFSDVEAGLTANKASADAGIAKAQATAEELPYVVGSYRGSSSAITVEVGFPPSAVLIGTSYIGASAADSGGRCALIGRDNFLGVITFTDTGFVLPADTGTFTCPRVNGNGVYFYYIAFR